jgi:hypothetical protein
LPTWTRKAEATSIIDLKEWAKEWAMEKILRWVGLSFLLVANIIHEARNVVASYLFDLIFLDDHFTK